MSNLDSSLDSVLIQLGDFGKFQSFIFGLVCFATILHSGAYVAFVFTARDVEYRCEIPKCDTENSPFDPPWLQNAVPFDGKVPDKCIKYAINGTDDFANCTETSNFTTKVEKCNKFVYKTREKSILQEYNLHCDDNVWKLTLVGTINNMGQFLSMFISGIISDKFGRKIVFILGLIFCSICGLIRTQAPSYIWFLVFEFLDAVFGAGSYVCGFILGVELVGPKRRILISTLLSSSYTLGEVFVAGLAWKFQDWRLIIYFLYGPPLFLFAYFWIIPESIRWNLSKGKIEEAKETLKRVAKVNGKEISEHSLEKLFKVSQVKTQDSFFDVFKSPILVCRLVVCFFCWITCSFLFFGLTLNSIDLAGDPYLDFILTTLVEIPAYFACIYLVDKLGRKRSLSGSFFLTGISCCLFTFIPKGSPNVSLFLWLLAKFGSTAAYTVIFVITSELFPTPLRHSLVGACSTFSTIGSMVAPQTPLLAQIWDPLPTILYTIMAVIAGFLTLLFPETRDVRLPDTIEEAVRIGKGKMHI
ncbi:solute carrier family 22 member 3-like [Tribolium madens]|uniref:solute carrier family 22 member 3-like n=1 Tax=Tribolium madens TaxID=41895 RepID=UPI001CF74C93|nr:solute carrier family 22 member 3-like [Tribolium madens]